MLYRLAGVRHTNYRAARQLFPVPFDRWLLIVVLVLAIAAPFYLSPLHLNSYLMPWVIWATAALGLNLLMGWAGQVHLGYAAVMAIGAYTAIHAVRAGVPFEFALMVGGLASSVKSGIAAVPDNADGAVICLGDMPLIDAGLIDRLIEAFAPDRGNLIVVPVADGRRGNPVLWSRRFFKELMTLDGDIGARHLIARHAEAVADVPVEGNGAFLDIDTPQALEAARRG